MTSFVGFGIMKPNKTVILRARKVVISRSEGSDQSSDEILPFSQNDMVVYNYPVVVILRIRMV